MFMHRNRLQENTTKRRKRSPLLLVLTAFSIIALSSLIFLLPPNWQFKVGSLSLQILYIFFPILFLFLFSFITYLFRSKTHGVLVASFTIVYLIFRLNNLTHPFFLMLLLLLLLTLELLVSHKK